MYIVPGHQRAQIHRLHCRFRARTFPNPCTFLSGGTRYEEPLVNGGVNLLRGKLLVGRKLRQLVGADAAGRVGDRGVGANGS